MAKWSLRTARCEQKSDKYPIFKLPVLRGLGTLGQAMWLGMRALKFSANARAGRRQAGEAGKPKEVSSWMMALKLVFSLLFFIVLYKFVPLYLGDAARTRVPGSERAIRHQHGGWR